MVPAYSRHSLGLGCQGLFVSAGCQAVFNREKLILGSTGGRRHLFQLSAGNKAPAVG